LRIQEKIESGEYSAFPLSEQLILQLHKDFCGDLVPEWAGRWRSIKVQVGTHEPPVPAEIPLRMRDYISDLEARLQGDVIGPLISEHLAFAEARLLSIHPFADFNGRLTRLWLWELLRRLRLPPVELAPTASAAMNEYLLALRAADRMDLQPLIRIWNNRLIDTAE